MFTEVEKDDEMGEEKITVRDEDGWSCTLSSYMSIEFGKTVAVWVTFPDGGHFHSGSSNYPFTEDGAREALADTKQLFSVLDFKKGK